MKSFPHFLPLALLALAVSTTYSQSLPATSPPEEVVNGDLGSKIDTYLSRLEVYGMSGSILVAKDGKVVLQKAYGLADRAGGVDLRTDMPMPIGSLSKQFIAAAIVKLESEGKLNITDSLPEFFDDVPADKRSITLHQLLSHTAGMRYLPEGDLFAPMERREVMRTTLALPLDRAPGEAFAYANTGYTLLAGVIEKASGMRYEEYLRSRFFAPLGMTSTGFEQDGGALEERFVVHSYTGENDEGPARDFPEAPRLTGAGSVVSTVADLYRWELALGGSQVLADTSRRKLFTPYAEAGGPVRHGYGWNVVTTMRNTTLIHHAGDIGGYNADFRRYVDEGLVLIFLSNARTGSGGYRQAVMNNVSLLVNKGSYPEPPAALNRWSASTTRFEGIYQSEAGENLHVWSDGERLMIGAERQRGISLLAGAGSDSTADVFNQATAEVLGNLLAGEWEQIREAFHPSLPFAAVREELTRQLQSWKDSLGAPGIPEILGSGALGPGTARSYARMQFERGSVLQEISWAGGKVVGFDQVTSRPMATFLAPLNDTSAASFDQFSGRSVSVTFSDWESGRPQALTLHSQSSRVTARRVEKDS